MFQPANFNKNKNTLMILNTSLVRQKLDTKEKVPKSKVVRAIAEFCARSTIHGIAYLVDRKRHFIERVWWIAAVVVSMIFCTYFIQSAYSRLSGDSIIVRVDNQQKPIGYVPFPVVTICPIARISVQKLNYTDVYRAMLKIDGNSSRNVTQKELDIMNVAAQVCKKQPDPNFMKLLTDLYLNESSYETLIEIAPRLNEMAVLCKLFDTWVDCEEIISVNQGDKGLCGSFNTISIGEHLTDEVSFNVSEMSNLTRKRITPSRWDPDIGYLVCPFEDNVYPRRVFSTGKEFSLVVVLKLNTFDIDYLCGGEIQGFKVVFHAPNESPHMVNSFFYLSPGKSSVYRVDPVLIETSFDAKQHPPEERQCYLNSERKLRFFKQYTQRNCEVECLSNYTLKQCSCVPFPMIHSKMTKLCGPAKMQCNRRAGFNFYSRAEREECNCALSCLALSYRAYQSTADYDLVSAYSKSVFHEDFNLENATFSRLIVSFRDGMFLPMKRTVYHEVSDFVSSFGSLFSLFMGASLLSFMELIYLFTIRIFVTYRDTH